MNRSLGVVDKNIGKEKLDLLRTRQILLLSFNFHLKILMFFGKILQSASTTFLSMKN